MGNSTVAVALKNKLFLAQIVVNLSPVVMIAYAKQFHYGVAFLVYFLTGCLGMSVTYHRLISHKAFEATTLFKVLGLFLGTIGLTGSALAWCAVHREHHLAPDTPDDPHSPHAKPYWWVEFASMFHKPKARHVRPFLKSPLIVFFHRHYFKINMAYALILSAIDPIAVIYAYLFPAFLLWHGGSLINLACHLWGYRNFEVPDKSTNNLFLGYLMWGEGWHNNHHKFPSKANNRVRWFELDISYWVILLVQKKRTRRLNSE